MPKLLVLNNLEVRNLDVKNIQMTRRKFVALFPIIHYGITFFQKKFFDHLSKGAALLIHSH